MSLLSVAIAIIFLSICMGETMREHEGRQKSAQALPPTAAYGQCGGNGGTYNPICVTGYTCVYGHAYYSQCLPPTAAYGQCGGNDGTYNPICVTGYTCVYGHAYYSQCLPCGPGKKIPVCPKTVATPSASPTKSTIAVPTTFASKPPAKSAVPTSAFKSSAPIISKASTTAPVSIQAPTKNPTAKPTSPQTKTPSVKPSTKPSFSPSATRTFAPSYKCALTLDASVPENAYWSPNLESGSINGGNTQTVVCLTTNVITIGPNSFRKSSLTSIFISSTVQTIGYGAFQETRFLKSATISEGVKDIQSGAFAYTGLTSVIIPGTVQSIGSSAFYFSPDLNSVTFVGVVNNFEEVVFWNCYSLQTVYYPGSWAIPKGNRFPFEIAVNFVPI